MAVPQGRGTRPTADTRACRGERNRGLHARQVGCLRAAANARRLPTVRRGSAASHGRQRGAAHLGWPGAVCRTGGAPRQNPAARSQAMTDSTASIDVAAPGAAPARRLSSSRLPASSRRSSKSPPIRRTSAGADGTHAHAPAVAGACGVSRVEPCSKARAVRTARRCRHPSNPGSPACAAAAPRCCADRAGADRSAAGHASDPRRRHRHCDAAGPAGRSLPG